MMDYKFCPIASPLADSKKTKRLLKLISASIKQKAAVRGVKETVKVLRKGKKGIIILAANVSPIDVISHVPMICEELSCHYIFVPSRAELGSAAGTRRSTSCIFVPQPDSNQKDIFELYEKCCRD